MSFEPFFFTQDDDSHWYKVPTRIRAEWQAWRNLPEPDLEASDEAWNAYETPPADAERCEHPSNYVVREARPSDGEMWPCSEPATIDLVGLARGESESGVIGRLCLGHYDELVSRFRLYRVATLSAPAPMPHDPEWAIPQAADPNRCAKCGHAGTSHQGGYMTTAICSLCEDNGKYHKFEGGYVG